MCTIFCKQNVLLHTSPLFQLFMLHCKILALQNIWFDKIYVGKIFIIVVWPPYIDMCYACENLVNQAEVYEQLKNACQVALLVFVSTVSRHICHHVSTIRCLYTRILISEFSVFRIFTHMPINGFNIELRSASDISEFVVRTKMPKNGIIVHASML